MVTLFSEKYFLKVNPSVTGKYHWTEKNKFKKKTTKMMKRNKALQYQVCLLIFSFLFMFLATASYLDWYWYLTKPCKNSPKDISDIDSRRQDKQIRYTLDALDPWDFS